MTQVTIEQSSQFIVDMTDNHHNHADSSQSSNSNMTEPIVKLEHEDEQQNKEIEASVKSYVDQIETISLDSTNDVIMNEIKKLRDTHITLKAFCDLHKIITTSTDLDILRNTIAEYVVMNLKLKRDWSFLHKPTNCYSQTLFNIVDFEVNNNKDTSCYDSNMNHFAYGMRTILYTLSQHIHNP